MTITDSYTREQLRRNYADAWSKHTSQVPPAPQEAMIADVIGAHPEYQAKRKRRRHGRRAYATCIACCVHEAAICTARTTRSWNRLAKHYGKRNAPAECPTRRSIWRSPAERCRHGGELARPNVKQASSACHWYAEPAKLCFSSARRQLLGARANDQPFFVRGNRLLPRLCGVCGWNRRRRADAARYSCRHRRCAGRWVRGRCRGKARQAHCLLKGREGQKTGRRSEEFLPCALHGSDLTQRVIANIVTRCRAKIQARSLLRRFSLRRLSLDRGRFQAFCGPARLRVTDERFQT